MSVPVPYDDYPLGKMQRERDEARKELATITPLLANARFHMNAICALIGKGENDVTNLVSEVIKERDKLKGDAEAWNRAYHEEKKKNAEAVKDGLTQAVGVLKGLHAAYPELVTGENVCFIGSQILNHRDRLK